MSHRVLNELSIAHSQAFSLLIDLWNLKEYEIEDHVV